MTVLEPLKVTIENYPHDTQLTQRRVKGSHVIYFDKVDFNEVSALSFLSFSFSFVWFCYFTFLFKANGTHTHTRELRGEIRYIHLFKYQNIY